MMKALDSFETSLLTRATRLNVPEDGNLRGILFPYEYHGGLHEHLPSVCERVCVCVCVCVASVVGRQRFGEHVSAATNHANL
jgi:hypothetical protein